MCSLPEEKLKALISAAHDDDDVACIVNDNHGFDMEKYRNWFLQQFDKSIMSPHDCSLEIFGVYFLNGVRQNTEIHLRTNETADTGKCQTPKRTNDNSTRNVTTLNREKINLTDLQQHSTPEKLTTSAGLINLKNIATSILDDSNNTQTPTKLHNLSIVDNSPITPIKPINSSYTQQQQQQQQQHHNQQQQKQNQHSNTSTPVRRPQHQQQQQRRSNNANNNNNNNSSYGNLTHSSEKLTRSGPSSGFCLGDFLIANSPTAHNRSSGKKKAQQTPTTPATSQQHQQQQQQQQQQIALDKSANASTSTGKPKKRVVPTTISTRTTLNNANNSGGGSSNSPFGIGNSSFGNENNILNISNIEVIDTSQCAILEARKALKAHPCEISKELQAATKTITTSASASADDLCAINERQTLPKINDESTVAGGASGCRETHELNAQFSQNLVKISEAKILKKLAKIYAILIDLNFTTNVLSELSFLLNLLNAKYQQQQSLIQVAQHNNVEKMESLQLTTVDDNQKSEQKKQEEEEEQQHLDHEQDLLKLLCDFKNCIYFAVQVLEFQRSILFLLDLKSISVILDNERLQILSTNLKQQLQNVYQLKQQNSSPPTLRFDKIFKNVYFQDDEDSRNNFTSNSEFGAFKTQRDLFYKSIQIWETNHLKPTWNFSNEITPKIRDIFKQSENPINMAHFAKLFVSQLLISASDATSPEDIGLDSVDMQKISKLTQRLITPSNFSVDYQFPRSQGFFRDFICEARSIAFVVQLKMALYSQLITLNDSHFEHLSFDVSGMDEEEVEYSVETTTTPTTKTNIQNEYIVRAEVLTTMLILAKFLGFVTAQPFNAAAGGANMSSSLEKKQLNLRSLFQPNFDTCRILQLAIKNGKLLITLPWLVQYFALLDNVTLQLDNYANTTQVLCALYMHLGINNLTFSATAKFIICCCIGWLFETKSILAEQYYNYRTKRTTLLNKTIEELNEVHNVIATTTTTTASKSTSKISTTITTLNSSTNTNLEYFVLNRMLESTLNVACPFLAAFRVSIMPAKYQTVKYTSRTGRYRYITTRISETSALVQNTMSTNNGNSCNNNNNNNNNNDNGITTAAINAFEQQQQQQQDQDNEELAQKKLIEAFLHSQNASMRRLIEFVIERTYKSVVKDAQNEILLPSKSAADNEVNLITSIDANEVQKSVQKIYDNAMKIAIQKWDTNIDDMINKRIERALEALLPTETMDILKRTYHFLIYQSAKIKIQDWRLSHVDKANFYYSSDLDDMTDKICKSNRKKHEQIPTEISSTELKLVNDTPSVSDLIDDLQLMLHCTSIRLDLLVDDRPIFAFFQRLPLVFVNVLPTAFYRLVGSGIVQLLQNLIMSLPHWMTKQLINAACDVWAQPQMIRFAYRYPLKAPTTGTTSTTELAVEMEMAETAGAEIQIENEAEATEPKENLNINFDVIPGIFDGLIKISFINRINAQRICYEKLKDLLVTLIQKNVISVDYINELFVPIFKEDWSTQVLNEISLMLRIIAQETAGCRFRTAHINNVNVNDNDNDNDNVVIDNDDAEDNGKAHLFMEVLSDFARDVDEF